MKSYICHANARCVSFISLQLAFANISNAIMTSGVCSTRFIYFFDAKCAKSALIITRVSDFDRQVHTCTHTTARARASAVSKVNRSKVNQSQPRLQLFNRSPQQHSIQHNFNALCVPRAKFNKCWRAHARMRLT